MGNIRHVPEVRAPGHHQQQEGWKHGASFPSSPGSGVTGRLSRTWRWFWFILVRNRFVIAIASLIWLIWRSGTQPRRLAYPCQQAAAANLGVFAVLVVPALARRRKDRRGSTLPPAVQLATGSVALAGVLFVLVSAGVAVYSDYAVDYSPGNPALVDWPRLTAQDLANPDYGLSPRVFAPNDEEAVVAINRNDSVTYGTLPYGPGTNQAYDLIWQTVADLHLGPYANPLRDLVEDVNGDQEIRVVLEPNWVEYYPVRGGVGDPEGRSPAYTHPAMMRPMVDMAVAAGATEIIIGDSSGNPDNSCVANMGYQELITWLANHYPTVDITPYPVNFQDTGKFTWATLGTGSGGESAYAGSGYSYYHLRKANVGESSQYFATADSHGMPGPGVTACMGAYAVTDYLIDADVIVNMPKVKVHFHNPNTLAIKNWVGTTMLCTYNNYSNVGSCRISHTMHSTSSIYEESFGNDCMWRELADLHRIYLYWVRGSGVQPTPQRKYLTVMDGIVCGETDLYFNGGPTHWRANTVLASVDPVAIDAVTSRIQRYKFDNTPITNNANAVSDWPIGTSDPGELRVVSGAGTMIDSSFDHPSIYDDTHNPGLTWPDWDTTRLNDLTPPAINLVTAQNLGGGTWDVQADISNAHVAFYYYGDDGSGTGARNVVRLGKNGDTFSATITGAAGSGTVVAQDEYFNTATADIVSVPVIGLSTHQLDHTIHCSENPDHDTFTVANIGVGTLNYTIEVVDQPSWLDVYPDSGTSTGEPDAITVEYNCSGLLPETYLATIRVSDPNAANNPQDIAVTLVVETVAGDFDEDCDVDQEDFGHLQVCLTGPGTQVTDPDCTDADIAPLPGGDGDVDHDDFGILQGCMSGPNVIADKACDDLP